MNKIATQLANTGCKFSGLPQRSGLNLGRDRARPGGANRYNPTARPPVFRFALSGEE
jgi:hypothetical protein